MTRRKSVCSKWTFVLLVVTLCPYVYSRPQDSPTVTSVSKSENVDTTESPIRYRYRNINLSSSRSKLPLVTNVTHVSNTHLNKNFTKIPNSTPTININTDYLKKDQRSRHNITSRESRVVKNLIRRNQNRKENIGHSSKITAPLKHSEKLGLAPKTKKPEIRRVLTKWSDNTNVEDLDFSYEATTSEENRFTFVTESIEDYIITENLHDVSTPDPKIRKPVKLLNKLKHKIHRHKRPRPEYEDGTHVQSDNIQVVASNNYGSARPAYIFTTPTPTPIITNVGNPMPWPAPSNIQATYHYRPNNNNHHKPTTRRPTMVTKPLKNQYNNYHNPVHNYPQYPGHEFEVTTFQPTNAYADRIVIRPEEYAASPDECPTIFLTLNNTFQGQGKEACPDLNIAVNTNVVNKNVVVESDEEENGDGIFGDPFGIPFDGESADDSEATHHGYDSEENQEQVESASIEGQALTNYNAATDVDSPEAGGFGSPSSILSSLSKPSHDDDDDLFSFSSLVQFFKPAVNALGWLATISPLSFGLFSMLLAPVVFLFAGTSGVASLFAPWAFSAREAPKIVHVYRPYWHWDDEIKTWHLHSFPNTRRWNYRLPRNSREESTNTGSVKPTFFYRMKEWMRNATHRLRQNSNNQKISNLENRKNKRKKRETWTIRIT